MELRQLRHFLALAEEMHFGRAALRLHISQPALSTSIHRLEEEFGVRLFERDSKGVRITLAGERMLDCARDMLDSAARTTNVSRALAGGKLGRVEVGFTGTVLDHGVDRVIAECRATLTDIDIVMREITSQKQADLLRTGRLDAGFVSFPIPPAGLEVIELFEDRFVVCLPAGHRLARRKAIDIVELRDEDFIMQSRDRAPNIHDQLIGLCATGGFYPRVSFESDHALSTLHLVARGLGVAFVLESLSGIGLHGAVLVPLKLPLPRRCGYFVWSPERTTPGLAALVEQIRGFAARKNRQARGIRKTND